jgi:hypothetical protein
VKASTCGQCSAKRVEIFVQGAKVARAQTLMRSGAHPGGPLTTAQMITIARFALAHFSHPHRRAHSPLAALCRSQLTATMAWSIFPPRIRASLESPLFLRTFPQRICASLQYPRLYTHLLGYQQVGLLLSPTLACPQILCGNKGCKKEFGFMIYNVSESRLKELREVSQDSDSFARGASCCHSSKLLSDD